MSIVFFILLVLTVADASDVLWGYDMDVSTLPNEWIGSPPASITTYSSGEPNCPDTDYCWGVSDTATLTRDAMSTLSYTNVHLVYSININGVNGGSDECYIQYTTDGNSINFISDDALTWSSNIELIAQTYNAWTGADNNPDGISIQLKSWGMGHICYFNKVFLYGDPPATLSPTTSSPTTTTPSTAAPTDITMTPTTNMPVTMQPTTVNPVTINPTTSAPVTSNPTTNVPSFAPSTSNPTTIPTITTSYIVSTSEQLTTSAPTVRAYTTSNEPETSATGIQTHTTHSTDGNIFTGDHEGSAEEETTLLGSVVNNDTTTDDSNGIDTATLIIIIVAILCVLTVIGSVIFVVYRRKHKIKAVIVDNIDIEIAETTTTIGLGDTATGSNTDNNNIKKSVSVCSSSSHITPGFHDSDLLNNDDMYTDAQAQDNEDMDDMYTNDHIHVTPQGVNDSHYQTKGGDNQDGEDMYSNDNVTKGGDDNYITDDGNGNTKR